MKELEKDLLTARNFSEQQGNAALAQVISDAISEIDRLKSVLARIADGEDDAKEAARKALEQAWAIHHTRGD